MGATSNERSLFTHACSRRSLENPIKKQDRKARRRRMRIQAKRERRAAKRGPQARADRKAARIRRSTVVKYLSVSGGRYADPLPGGRGHVSIPERFSFLDEPELAIETLRKLAEEVAHPSTSSVWVDQEMVRSLDHCAESVASALLREAKQRLGVDFNGRYPKDPTARRIVEATGMPRVLGLAPRAGSRVLKRFHLVRGGHTEATAWSSTLKEVVAGKFTLYVNDCLRHYGYELDEEAAEFLGWVVGEILANAEDHSGTSDWWIGGYLDQPKGQMYGDCHVTIFNFGRTIYQSLQDLPPGSRLRTDIELRTARHTRQGYFRATQWTEENLWTVYALQEAVSRHNTQPEVLGHRGVGTVRMIEFFQSVGQSAVAASRPKMCIVSGHTYIGFDESTYAMDYVTTETGQKRRVLAFNPENDLDRPPDPKYVRNLDAFFPGTLVSLRFFLDEDHLATLSKDDDDGED